jgi:hypothetical protein
MTNHHENREPTPEEKFWGAFFAATIGMYLLVMVIIPSIRFMNGL